MHLEHINRVSLFYLYYATFYCCEDLIVLIFDVATMFFIWEHMLCGVFINHWQWDLGAKRMYAELISYWEKSLGIYFENKSKEFHIVVKWVHERGKVMVKLRWNEQFLIQMYLDKSNQCWERILNHGGFQWMVVRRFIEDKDF